MIVIFAELIELCLVGSNPSSSLSCSTACKCGCLKKSRALSIPTARSPSPSFSNAHLLMVSDSDEILLIRWNLQNARLVTTTLRTDVTGFMWPLRPENSTRFQKLKKSFLEYFFNVIRNVTRCQVIHRIPEIKASLDIVVFARETKNS